MTRSQDTSTGTHPQAKMVCWNCWICLSALKPGHTSTRAKPYRTRHPLDHWVTIDDKTCHIMSPEYTKHMTEKDLHRNLPSVRDIRTSLSSLIICDTVVPNVRCTTRWRDHTTDITDSNSGAEWIGSRLRSFRSDCERFVQIPHFCQLWVLMMQWSILGCKRLVYGRVDFVEVCCTSDSLLSGAVTSAGGRPVQYSHWNGFDRSHHEGRNGQVERRSSWEEAASCVDDSSLYHTTHTTDSIKIKVSSNTNEQPGCASLACKVRTGVERFWNRCGVSRVLVVVVFSE